MLTCSFTVGPIFLKDLPDPERCYEGLSSTNNITGVSVFVPDIRDSQGKIIPPMEYEKKFVDGTVVEVEVVPKLYLYLFFLWCQLIYFSAGCSHHVQKLPGIRLMGRMRTSSRFLKMKIMPYSDYVRSSFVSKGKRKASDDLGSPSKKTATAATPGSLEWSDLSDSDHAMDVEKALKFSCTILTCCSRTLSWSL